MHASWSLTARGAAFAALALGMLLAQLEGTITVAALPAIVTDLGSSTAVAGVTAMSLLAVSVSTPVWGALGDRWGRRRAFVCSVLLFAAGSVLCAAAPSLPLLIAARAVQGVGGGGLIVGAVTALGELFGPEELVRRQIWLTGLSAVSAIAGPPLGGFVADGPGWRWIFLGNLPLSTAALLLGMRGLPGGRSGLRPAGFDVAGAALIAGGGAAAVALGSFDAVATSPLWAPVLGLVVVVSAAAFVCVERRARAPLVPPRIFAAAGLARSVAVTGLTGAALFGTFAFVPLGVAAGLGTGTAATSVLLLLLTGGQLLVGTAFSVLARRFPSMVVWGRIALVLGLIGLGLLALVPQLAAQPGTATGAAVAGLALSGAALGLSMPAYTLLAQATAPRESFGAAMATLTFARQIGGALGAAGYGWLLLAVPDRDLGLSVVLTSAAATVVAALALGPRRAHEPSHGAPDPAPVAGKPRSRDVVA